MSAEAAMTLTALEVRYPGECAGQPGWAPCDPRELVEWDARHEELELEYRAAATDLEAQHGPGQPTPDYLEAKRQLEQHFADLPRESPGATCEGTGLAVTETGSQLLQFLRRHR